VSITLAEAADQLGVHYMTAYRYVRTGRMVAEKRNGKWWVAPEDIDAVLAEGTGRRRGAVGENQTPRQNLVEPFRARLVAGDTAGCWDLISAALAGGATPVEVHRKFLQPAMAAVGEGWSRGELSISDEHRATASAYRLLGQMGPLFRHRGRRRGTIVVGAASGDYHALPTAILADMLCDRRFDVIDLGANTPSESFLDAARQADHLVGIGLCVVVTESLDTACTQLREIRAELPNVFLVAGGSPIVNSGDPEFEALADAVTTDSAEACDAFEQASLALLSTQ